jgi:hypothetical protein
MQDVQTTINGSGTIEIVSGAFHEGKNLVII